ncbi:AbrB/MazE/SpoVT family DNA-binding domain-containing protein [Sphingosinicella terrae]|uniref:AbrB/MazE/SpoVT family DNA-binding domain-containing protein n=1 Tax=Sphingosinicella terrae TaxID=2172047 RepID=UPI000E0D1BC5|nr:AbrB/MazE/SpoVT family DNA-binding domain-containing protein [Sphingosinicella terrae]
MARGERLTTTVSTKGQVILPKAIRRLRRWDAGTRLVVEDREDGVLLKPAPLFAPTQIDDVFGCLAYSGKAKTIEEMDAAVADEARRRARD